MSFKDLDMKTLRRVLVLVWFALATLHLIVAILSHSSFSWFFAGFMIGGAFIMLLNHPHMNWQDKFIKTIMHINSVHIDAISAYQKMIEQYSKKVKGGKKKK